jgi:Nif11 domain
VATDPQPLLDALDHLCHQVDGDPEIEEEFYGATTPEELVALAVERGIFIDADDFRALLRSGSTERWIVRGGDQTNPIAHLQQVFRV